MPSTRSYLIFGSLLLGAGLIALASPGAASADLLNPNGNAGIGNTGGVGNVGLFNGGTGNVGVLNSGLFNRGMANGGVANSGILNSGVGKTGSSTSAASRTPGRSYVHTSRRPLTT
jgi:hypothetical protein